MKKSTSGGLVLGNHGTPHSTSVRVSGPRLEFRVRDLPNRSNRAESTRRDIPCNYVIMFVPLRQDAVWEGNEAVIWHLVGWTGRAVGGSWLNWRKLRKIFRIACAELQFWPGAFGITIVPAGSVSVIFTSVRTQSNEIPTIKRTSHARHYMLLL
jgi:hypothetical protein